MEPEPRIRRRVFRAPSNSVATTTNALHGHHPGNGMRPRDASTIAAPAHSATIPMKIFSRDRVVDIVDFGESGIPDCSVNLFELLRLRFPQRRRKESDCAREQLGRRREPADLQHERHPPSSTSSYSREVARLAMACLTLRSISCPLTPLAPYLSATGVPSPKFLSSLM
jgi:hypothetical protein